jgi:hypothetical protein
VFSQINAFFSFHENENINGAGRPKKYSDCFIFKLGVLKVVLGIDTENKFLSIIRDSKRYEYLGDIPSNSVFNTRLRKLCSDKVIVSFFEKLLEIYSDFLKSNVRIVDSEPIIFKNFKRKDSKNDRIFGMDVGYCASLDEYYFGYKLHFLITEDGFPSRFMFSKASEFDNNVLMDLTYNLENIKLVCDKAYIDKEDKNRLKSLRNIDKITPYRSNMKKVTLTDEENGFLKLRGQVERDFSAFTNMNLKRCKAKSSLGVFTRVSIGIVAFSLVYIANMTLYDTSSIAYCKHFR